MLRRLPKLFLWCNGLLYLHSENSVKLFFHVVYRSRPWGIRHCVFLIATTKLSWLDLRAKYGNHRFHHEGYRDNLKLRAHLHPVHWWFLLLAEVWFYRCLFFEPDQGLNILKIKEKLYHLKLHRHLQKPIPFSGFLSYQYIVSNHIISSLTFFSISSFT